MTRGWPRVLRPASIPTAKRNAPGADEEIVGTSAATADLWKKTLLPGPPGRTKPS